ncbi:hypothetical protein EU73_15040, partial [Staphylococcus aureus]|uniref:hypothetical protein n=1 Tax=Staphylococcus aureus TaxID=1280 RepID=UPI00065B9A48
VYSGEHEVVTNEKSLFVIDEFYDVAIAIYYLDGKLKVAHVNYGSDFTIDVANKDHKEHTIYSLLHVKQMKIR